MRRLTVLTAAAKNTRISAAELRDLAEPGVDQKLETDGPQGLGFAQVETVLFGDEGESL
jgi:hypothetical protein